MPPPNKPIPTLMQHLRRAYGERVLELRKASDASRSPAPEGTKHASAYPDTPEGKAYQAAISLDGFVGFCEDYLNEHRVTAPWYADDGLGLIFADNTRVTINVQGENANSGQMQPSGAVDVMEGKGFGSHPI